MMIKQLEFKGIVRATSAMNNADGNCEEVVNLRKENGVHRVVGKKKVLIKDVDYEQIYIHKSEDFENYIGIKSGKVIWFASRVSGKIETKNQVICDVVGEVSINQVNNILLIKNDSGILKSVFMESYETTIETLPDVPVLLFDVNKNPDTPVSYTKLDYDLTTQEKEAKEHIAGIFNKFKADNPNCVEGRVFICTSYTLFDGSETKISAPLCIDLGDDGFTKGIIRSNGKPFNDGRLLCDVKVAGLSLYKLIVRNPGIDEKHKDIVSKVNVYVSQAYSHYDLDNIRPNYIIAETATPDSNNAIPEKKLIGRDIDKMLLYKIASFSANDYFSVDVNFNQLTTFDTMPVDTSGWANMTGDMFVYNNRLHLFNRTVSFSGSDVLGKSYSMANNRLLPSGFDKRQMTAVVYLKAGRKDLILKYDFDGAWIDKNSGGKTIRFPKVVSFPDSRAYKIVFYDSEKTCTPFTVLLSKSDTYNMAFAVLNDHKVDMNWGNSTAVIPGAVNFYKDTISLTVSESSNPYYFPPEHSYLMPGEVINLAVNTEQISASQVGMYPLYVFTIEGIYALQVGDGKVLYSNVIPISSEVAVKGSNVLQTKYGIAFVTESGLKLISGSEVVDLSEAVSGDVDKHVRNSPVFGKFEKIPLVLNPYYMLSRINFGEYIKGAVMGYDISKDELIISNSEYKYSYVYNLKVKAWHKITEVFTDFNRHLCITNKIHREATRACAVIRFSGIYKPNDWLTITIGSQRIEYTINSTRDYSGTVIPHIIEQIQGFVAEQHGDSIFIYANEVGVRGNDIPLTLEFSGETSMTTDGFIGGKDEYDEGSIDVCDIREEVACVMPVYLQTRPISLDSFGFKKVLRMLFRGEFKPSELFYVAPMLASNDLVQWLTVGCVDTNKPKTFMEMKRAACSYRHFMILMSGTVESGHVISIVEIEGEETLNNRLR